VLLTADGARYWKLIAFSEDGSKQNGQEYKLTRAKTRVTNITVVV